MKNFYPFNYGKGGVKLIEDNRCVIGIDMGHLCGYVAFKPKDVPEEWHGQSDASGLQYLKIHGGITYADIASDGEEASKIASKNRNDKLEKMRKEIDIKNDSQKYWDERKKIITEELEEKKSLGYDWVIFGFDCAHADDEFNSNLRDPKHVMELTKQMESQMKALAERWVYYKGEDQDSKCKLLDEIRAMATINTSAGMGEMLGMLSGGDNI